MLSFRVSVLSRKLPSVTTSSPGAHALVDLDELAARGAELDPPRLVLVVGEPHEHELRRLRAAARAARGTMTRRARAADARCAPRPNMLARSAPSGLSSGDARLRGARVRVDRGRDVVDRAREARGRRAPSTRDDHRLPDARPARARLSGTSSSAHIARRVDDLEQRPRSPSTSLPMVASRCGDDAGDRRGQRVRAPRRRAARRPRRARPRARRARPWPRRAPAARRARPLRDAMPSSSSSLLALEVRLGDLDAATRAACEPRPIGADLGALDHGERRRPPCTLRADVDLERRARRPARAR